MPLLVEQIMVYLKMLFTEWSSQFNYGQYYFQFKDDNQNMMYDAGEIYAVSLENGTNGEMHGII